MVAVVSNHLFPRIPRRIKEQGRAMDDLLEMLLDRLAAGECLVRAIIAASEGSAPRSPGTFMLISPILPSPEVWVRRGGGQGH
jgi:hypothetical protein